MTNKTTEQANIVGEAAVGSANDLGQKTVEGVENVAASTGLVNPVSACQACLLTAEDDTPKQALFPA